MASACHITELSNRLRIQVREDSERWERMLVGCFAALVVGVASLDFLGAWWCAVLSPIAAIIGFALAKSTSAELNVTNFEFTTKGNLGRRQPRSRIVYTGDVRRLEFRREISPFWKDNSPLHFGTNGLQAVTAHGTTCILPFVDFDQVGEVIRAIEKKFPGLAESWRSGEGAKVEQSFGGKDKKWYQFKN